MAGPTPNAPKPGKVSGPAPISPGGRRTTPGSERFCLGGTLSGSGPSSTCPVEATFCAGTDEAGIVTWSVLSENIWFTTVTRRGSK